MPIPDEPRLWAVGLALVCALLGAVAQILFKVGSTALTVNPIDWVTNPRIILGGILYLIAAVLFLWALKHENVSLLYPVIATSYIWVALLSNALLGEPFPPIKWLGIGFIMTGVILIVR